MTKYLSSQDLERISEKKDIKDIPRLVKEIERLKQKRFVQKKEHKIDRVDRLAERLITDHSSYHTQKERMSHAGFLLQVAIFGAIMSSNEWPPAWIPNGFISSKIITAIAFSYIWVIIHIFIRWQLRNRRWAAIQYAGVLRAIRRWALCPPSEDELLPYEPLGKVRKVNRFYTFLDFIIPVQSAQIFSDVEKKGYPKGIVAGLTEQEKKRKGGTGALFAEGLVTYSSLLIYFSILYRTVIS